MNTMTRFKSTGPTLLKAALASLDRGWSIVPLSAEKLPHWVLTETGHFKGTGAEMRPSWKVLQEQKPTEQEVRHWFARGRDTLLAVVCGEVSGIVVLDFDGAEGRLLLKTLGLHPHVQTGSGGYHVYFKHPGHRISTLSGKNKKDLPGHMKSMDVRGDGGMAILPPSVSCSGPYTLLRPFDDLDSLLDLPSDLRKWFDLDAPTSSPPLPRPRVVRSSSTPRSTQVSSDHLLLEALKRAPSGRNDAGFWLSCQLRDNNFSQSEALQVLEQYVDHVETQGTSPYTLSEAQASLSSAYRGRKRRAWHEG